MLGGVGQDKEENGGEEDSVVYIGDMLDVEDAMEYGNGREGVSSQPPVVTRSERVLKKDHMDQWIQPAGGLLPSHGRSPTKTRSCSCTAQWFSKFQDQRSLTLQWRLLLGQGKEHFAFLLSSKGGQIIGVGYI